MPTRDCRHLRFPFHAHENPRDKAALRDSRARPPAYPAGGDISAVEMPNHGQRRPLFAPDHEDDDRSYSSNLSKTQKKKIIDAVALGLNLKLLKLRTKFQKTLRPQVKSQTAV